MEYCVAMFDNPRLYPKVTPWAARFLGGGTYPSHNTYIFFDSTGKEMSQYRLSTDCTPRYLAELVLKVITAHGKGVGRKEYAKCMKDMEKAKKLLEIEYYGAACELYQDLAKMKCKVEPEFVKTSKEKVNEIEKKIEEEIEEAKGEIESGNKKEALTALRELEPACKKHKLSKKITELITTLEKDTDVAETKKDAEKLGAARELYLTAEKHLIDGNKRSAKAVFMRLQTVGKGTPYEEKAAARLEELKD